MLSLISDKITLFSPEIQYQLLSVHLKEIWLAALWEAQRIPLHRRFVENATEWTQQPYLQVPRSCDLQQIWSRKMKTFIITNNSSFSLLTCSLHSVLNAVKSSQTISTNLLTEAPVSTPSVHYTYPNDKDRDNFHGVLFHNDAADFPREFHCIPS